EGNDIILGGGNDGAATDPNPETLTGNAGDDILLGDYGQVTLVAGFATEITSTDLGKGGDDIISGNAGNDIILAGQGNDIVNGDDALTDHSTGGSGSGAD